MVAISIWGSMERRKAALNTGVTSSNGRPANVARSTNRQPIATNDRTINELILAYWRFAKKWYGKK
jgi:hypothetical protein